MADLYRNIKNKRTELGMSQQELALKVGYSGKSMISKVERGEVDLSTTMIKKFADALSTTASELMGWDGVEWNPKEQEITVPTFNISRGPVTSNNLKRKCKGVSAKCQMPVQVLIDTSHSMQPMKTAVLEEKLIPAGTGVPKYRVARRNAELARKKRKWNALFCRVAANEDIFREVVSYAEFLLDRKKGKA